MQKWCPCVGWCLSDPAVGGEAKVLLHSVSTPSYSVRRISSFGQTVLNESGEEEEIARHGTVPLHVNNGQTIWTTATPVQPGVTKADIVSRPHKMASIPEVSSPKPKNRLKKSRSTEIERSKFEISPLRHRKTIATPQDFAEILHHQDNASEVSSTVSETNSEKRFIDAKNSIDDDDKEISPPLDVISDNKQVEIKDEDLPDKPVTSIFQLVKHVKKPTDQPKSPWMKMNDALDKPKSPILKTLDSESPLPKDENEVEPPKIVIDEAPAFENNSSEDITEDSPNTVEETKEDRNKYLFDEPEYDKKIEEEEDDEDDETTSQTASQATTQIEEELDEVLLDGSKNMDSAEIAKQYGLDLNLYDLDTAGVSTGSRDDDLSANVSIAKLRFTASFDREKNHLNITVEKIEGLGGQGLKNIEFDVIVKVGFIRGGHTFSTKASLSSKPINQSFSLHVKDLATSILRFSVYHSSWLGNHDALGHALFRINRCSQVVTHHTINVSPKSTISESAGLIEISFRYQEKVLYIIVHKVFDLLPSFRGCKLYAKVSYYNSSKKLKERISKTESGDKGFAFFNFEAKFNADKIVDHHTYVMISLKKKGENNKIFKNDKTLGRIFLGPLFYNGNKINFWGEAILNEKIMSHTFSLYL